MRSLGSAEIGSIGTIESEKSAMNEIGIKGFELYEDIILPQEEKLVYTKSEQDVIDA